MTAVYSAQRRFRAPPPDVDRHGRFWEIVRAKYATFPEDVQNDLYDLYVKASSVSVRDATGDVLEAALRRVADFERAQWTMTLADKSDIVFNIKMMTQPPFSKPTRILAKTSLMWLDSPWYERALEARWSLMSVFGVIGTKPLERNPEMTGLMHFLSFHANNVKLAGVEPGGRAKFYMGLDKFGSRRIGEMRFRQVMRAGSRPFWEALMPMDE